MAQRGRPPKPLALKLVSGTDQPCRRVDPLVIDGELLAELPPAPDWLTKEYALAEWHRLGPVLVRCKMLNAGNLTTFGVLCRVFADGLEGDDKSMAQYIKLVSEFGLTPASRGRVKVNATKDEKPTGFARFQEQAGA